VEFEVPLESLPFRPAQGDVVEDLVPTNGRVRLAFRSPRILGWVFLAVGLLALYFLLR
jgi:hypothetical protein